jgi:hypothetical protein
MKERIRSLRALAPDTRYVRDVDSGQASDPPMAFEPPPSVISDANW